MSTENIIDICKKFKTYNMLNKSVLFICFEREFVHGKIDDKKSKLK